MDEGQENISPDWPYHGSATGYQYGCRCTPCVEAGKVTRQASRARAGEPRVCAKCGRRYVYLRGTGTGTKQCALCKAASAPKVTQGPYGHSHVPCTVCGIDHLNAMHRAYPVCDPCWDVFPQPLVRTLVKHHAPPDFVRRCALDPSCWACQEDVLIKIKVPRKGTYRYNFALDHDHSCCQGPFSCGQCLRGLLCQRCNTGLGFLQDDLTIILGMVKYVESWSSDRASETV